jgi:hypothetical protein
MKTQLRPALGAILLLLAPVAILHGDDISSGTAPFRLNLEMPKDFQVAQRATRGEGTVVIMGDAVPGTKNGPLPDAIEARFVGKGLAGDLPGDWQPLPCDARVPGFRGTLTVPAGGWYRLEVRALQKGIAVATNTVEHVGVGEVFVVAGQSNSANYGEKRQTNSTGLVAAFDGDGWRLAGDPEPGASGTKGSFLPPFGDAMVARYNVPVGLVAMGIGSTSVREWLPQGTRMSNLPPLTRNIVTVGPGQWETIGKIFTNFTGRMKSLGPNGFRAVLWHQGESDAKQAEPDRSLTGSLYREDMEMLIRDSRKAVGWDMPWFVAQATYHQPNDLSTPEIRDAQKAVCDDGLAVLGPDTDTLTGDNRERKGLGIHLSDKGLHEHARLWVEKVGPWLDGQLAGHTSQ